jgi:hypothetical protein
VWFTHKFRLKHMLGWVFSHNSITEIWCPTVIAIYALVKTWYKYKYKYKYIYIWIWFMFIHPTIGISQYLYKIHLLTMAHIFHHIVPYYCCSMFFIYLHICPQVFPILALYSSPCFNIPHFPSEIAGILLASHGESPWKAV